MLNFHLAARRVILQLYSLFDGILFGLNRFQIWGHEILNHLPQATN